MRILLLLLFAIFISSEARVRWVNAPILNDSTISVCDSVGTGRWTQYGANGTVTEDATWSEKTPANAVRLTTLSNGSYVAAQLTTTFRRSDFDYYYLRCYIDSIANIATTNGLSIQFFSESGTSNGVAVDMNNAMRNNYKGGLITIAWPKSAMPMWSGTPLDTVARVVIRVYPTNGHVVNCWIDKLGGYDKPARDTIAEVAFGWDDYFISQYDTIYKMMRAYGWKNCLFGSRTGLGGTRLEQAKIDSLIVAGWPLMTHIYDHSQDYGQRTYASARNQLDSSIADVKADWLRVTGRTNKYWPIGAYPANSNGYYNDSTIAIMQSRGVQWYSSVDPSPRQHISNYRPLNFSNYFDYNTTTFAFFRATLDSAVKYKQKLFLRGHDAVPTITQSYQIRIDSLQRIMDTLRVRELAGQLRIVTYDKFWLYAPDSSISVSSTSGSYNYSVICNISADVDSMKLFLYDSVAGGSKTLRDSSVLTQGGGTASFSRASLLPSTAYFYWIYGRNNSGTWDSTLSRQSDTTKKYTGLVGSKAWQTITINHLSVAETSAHYLYQIKIPRTGLVASNVNSADDVGFTRSNDTIRLPRWVIFTTDTIYLYAYCC
jgi:hypothetical protein